jgi:hypothetical protein
VAEIKMAEILIKTWKGVVSVKGYGGVSVVKILFPGKEAYQYELLTKDEVKWFIIVLAHLANVGNTDTGEVIEVLKKEGKIFENGK